MSEIEIEELPEAERVLLQDALREATKTGEMTMDFAAQRVRASITVGNTLNYWREKVPSRTWGRWLQVNVLSMADITKRSLENWMRLAASHAEGKIKLEAGVGMRQALQQAGIIPPSDKTINTLGKVKGTAAIILAIIRVGNLSRRIAPGGLDFHQRQTLLSALEPLDDLRRRIAAHDAPNASQGSKGVKTRKTP